MINKPSIELDEVTIRLAGDSGDGMQLIGYELTQESALMGNDIETLPDFPAEIRAPAGTTAGVSGFQLHIGSFDIHTPGDEVDALVAMNPAALKSNIAALKPNGILIINIDSFNERGYQLAELDSDPLEDGTLDGFQVFKVELRSNTRAALKHIDLPSNAIDRCKNSFALGMLCWLYNRGTEYTREFLTSKFRSKPVLSEANITALQAGYTYCDVTESFANQYEIPPAKLPAGTYRNINGNEATALGLVAASKKSGIPLFYGAYPITPASEILHEISKYKHFGVKTFQAEDEIAACCAAIGASYAGDLGITCSAGPGIALKSEAINLAVMTELPLVVLDIQRAGPSTGMPTKTEQSDLLMALFGRNGESPVAVIAASRPADCFSCVYEAVRIAAKYMTPVIFLSDGYIGNGSEPWLVPDTDELKPFECNRNPQADPEGYKPFKRDPETLGPWALPGTPGLEHRIGGLGKQPDTGNVSYVPEENQAMHEARANKILGIQREIRPLEMFGDPDADLLLIGWGGTYGAIRSGAQAALDQGYKVAWTHLRWLNPLPKDLGEIIARHKKVMVPEINLGQLDMVIRSKFLVDTIPCTRINGLPYTSGQIEAKIVEALGAAS